MTRTHACHPEVTRGGVDQAVDELRLSVELVRRITGDRDRCRTHELEAWIGEDPVAEYEVSRVLGEHAELPLDAPCLLLGLAAVGDVLYDADQLDWDPVRVGEDIPRREDPALCAVRAHDPVLELVVALVGDRRERFGSHTRNIIRVDTCEVVLQRQVGTLGGSEDLEHLTGADQWSARSDRKGPATEVPDSLGSLDQCPALREIAFALLALGDLVQDRGLPDDRAVWGEDRRQADRYVELRAVAPCPRRLVVAQALPIHRSGEHLLEVSELSPSRISP